MVPLSIFLSHLTIEAKLADLLKRHLIRDFIGLVHVFVSSDSTSIPVGSKWLAELTNALQTAHLQIVLCSNDSVTRPWINYEVGAAGIRGILTVPVCHTGFVPARLPVPFSESEGIEANKPDGLRSLYRTIANMLGSDVPDIDFEAFSAEIAAFEKEYAQHLATVASTEDAPQFATEKIMNPRVLCVSSEQFLKLGFENQLDKVIQAFPSAIEHERVISSLALRQVLTHQRFEMIHISAYVCPRSGDLYFSEVNPRTGEKIGSNRDYISADDVRALCIKAKTRLVVIGSCDSLALATTLVRDMNVIAARDMVSTNMMSAWIATFYETLTTESLSSAFDLAIKASGAPMRLLSQKEMIIRVQKAG